MFSDFNFKYCLQPCTTRKKLPPFYSSCTLMLYPPFILLSLPSPFRGRHKPERAHQRWEYPFPSLREGPGVSKNKGGREHQRWEYPFPSLREGPGVSSPAPRLVTKKSTGKGAVNTPTNIPRSEVTDPNKFFIVCKKSRIESNTSFYGCFYLGPFEESLSQTLANDLRRTLLSELVGLAITSVEIEGVLHKFSSLPGLKEPVLDLICNLQTVVLKNIEKTALTPLKQTKKTYTGFLKVRGPRIIKARDLKLPAGIHCVDPNQYIATLAEDGILNMKFHINEGKSYVFQKPQNLDVTNLKKRNVLLYKTKKTKNSTNSEMLYPTGPLLRLYPPSSSGSYPVGVTTKGVQNNEESNNKENRKDSTFLKSAAGNNGVKSSPFSQRKELEASLPKLNALPLQPIPLDAVFMPVTRVNCIIEEDTLATDFNIFKNMQETKTLSALQNDHFKKLPGSNSKKALDSITNADVQAQNQTSLFFNNAFCLYKNNLKLNKLYSQIQKQTQLKLIPWYENLAYFTFFVNAGLYNTKTIHRDQIIKKREFIKSLKTTLNAKPISYNTAKSQVKTLLGSYDFNNYNISKKVSINNKDTLGTTLQTMKQEFTLPSVAKKLLYPEKYGVSLQKQTTFFIGEVGQGKKLGGGKVYSYQDYLNIEYSKILKLKPVTKKCHLILEIWTNGSIHPRQALYDAFSFLTNTFLKLQKVKMLGSMFRSELAYGNIHKYYTNTPLTLASNNDDKNAPSINSLQSKQIIQKRGQGYTIPLASFSFAYPKKRGKQSHLISSLELPIGVLAISLRAYTALRKAEIFTLSDLLNRSKGELLKLKNFGPKSLFEVEKTLADLGLSLLA